MRWSENNVPDCCDITVEDASSIEDGEGFSGMLLSIARVVLTTKDDKWICCNLPKEIVDDNNSKEGTEVTANIPCSVIRFELIVATDDESLLDKALEGTTDVDTRTDDVTSTDETSVKGVIVCLFAMPALSASNGELLMAKVLDWKSFGDDIDREDEGGTAAVFWLASFELTDTSKTPVDLLLVWSDDNTEADVINTKVAVIKFNRRSFWYRLYVGAVADRDLQIREGGRSSRPWDKGGARTQENFFRPFGPQFGLKVGGASLLDPPLTGVLLESSWLHTKTLGFEKINVIIARYEDIFVHNYIEKT